MRIVVPAAMHQETLNKLHARHQGIERCRQRASIVARNIQPNQGNDQQMPAMFERENPTEGTSYAFNTSRLPMAKDWDRSPHSRWDNLPTYY